MLRVVCTFVNSIVAFHGHAVSPSSLFPEIKGMMTTKVLHSKSNLACKLFPDSEIDVTHDVTV